MHTRGTLEARMKTGRHLHTQNNTQPWLRDRNAISKAASKIRSPSILPSDISIIIHCSFFFKVNTEETRVIGTHWVQSSITPKTVTLKPNGSVSKVISFYGTSVCTTEQNKKFMGRYNLCMPVPVAARSMLRTVFDCSNTGTVDSNTARGMYMCVCLRFSVLCCPV